MKNDIHKPFFTFHRKLFFTILSLFLLFVLFIGNYQYRREKSFRINLLTEQLQGYNNLIFERLSERGLSDSTIHSAQQHLNVPDLRITIVDYSGKVLYDTEAKHPGNHLNRPEIKAAIAEGQGVSVRRLSESTGKTFFYAATAYKPYLIRSSRPYDALLNNQLKADFGFVVFTGILLLVILFLLYQSTRRMGNTIAQLRDFAESADKNQPLDVNQPFPPNELGEISEHIVGLFKDVRDARDALMKEREKLFSHLQTAREGLAVFSPTKEEIIANNLFIQYLNLLSDVPAQSASAFFSLPEAAGVDQRLEEALHVTLPIAQLQHQGFQITKNGHTFQIQFTIFQDKSFEISINDVTQSEEESRLKRQLTQNIAHELRTPISSIQGYLETILSNPALSESKRNSFLERSYLQSKRLGELLRDISTLSRMDEAPGLIEKEELNICRLIDQVVNEVEGELESRGIQFHCDIDPTLTVRGNASLLYSVFRNLMDNALAYAGDRLEIGVHCFRSDKDRLYFSFYDTGVGIPEEHLNRIFERFYRVDKGRTRKLGGTGLGLAIVKNAIQLHGGSISAKNRAEGGLEFVFSVLR
jgi:two-component system OmpR family sensor kinase/two-component system phosphate regulon sensor histidine kinase PhoR